MICRRIGRAPSACPNSRISRMPATRVVNLRRERYDVYIGRGRGREFVWGNPFSHKVRACITFKPEARAKMFAKRCSGRLAATGS